MEYMTSIRCRSLKPVCYTLQVNGAFHELGLMGHLVGILTDSSTDAAPARFAALAAIRALCTSLRQAHADFFYYGGASTVLQSLLQEERGHDETLAAVSLLQVCLIMSVYHLVLYSAKTCAPANKDSQGIHHSRSLSDMFTCADSGRGIRRV